MESWSLQRSAKPELITVIAQVGIGENMYQMYHRHIDILANARTASLFHAWVVVEGNLNP